MKKLEVWQDMLTEHLSLLKEALLDARVYWKRILFLSTFGIVFLWVAIGWLLLEEEIVVVNDTNTKPTDVAIVQRLDPTTGEMVGMPIDIETHFVYTDKSAFIMKSNAFYLRSEVANTFGKLVSGKTYKFYHLGVRFPPLDMYENVIFVRDMETGKLLYGW